MSEFSAKDMDVAVAEIRKQFLRTVELRDLLFQYGGHTSSCGRRSRREGRCECGWLDVLGDIAVEEFNEHRARRALPAVPLSEDETPLSVRNSPDAPDGEVQPVKKRRGAYTRLKEAERRYAWLERQLREARDEWREANRELAMTGFYATDDCACKPGTVCLLHHMQAEGRA